MTKQVIGVGTVANDGTGDYLRPAFIKINENFTELYDFNASFSTVATSGQYSDLLGLPTIPSYGIFDDDTEGLVPQSGGGTTNFLRADGTWAEPPGGGGGGGGEGNVVADEDPAPTNGQIAIWQGGFVLGSTTSLTLSQISDAGTAAASDATDFAYVTLTDTETQLESDNPVLLDGQLAFESDTRRVKIGDGVSTYNSLNYIVSSATDLVAELTAAGYPPLVFSPSEPPVEGELITVDSEGRLRVADTFDTRGQNAPVTLAYADPLIVPLGDAPEERCFEVTCAGDVSIEAPETDEAAGFIAGDDWEIILINSGTDDFDAVTPFSSEYRFMPSPAMVQGAGSRTSVYCIIRDTDPSLVIDALVVPVYEA